MVRHSPLQQIKETKQIAKDYGMFVVEKGNQYLLYRTTPGKNVFLGKRSAPAAIRSFVAKCANFH